MQNRIIKALWGDLNKEELKKFVTLSCGMFFLIGSFWPLKVLKDGIFISNIGTQSLPNVKLTSLFIVFVLVLIYSKVISYLSRENFLYMLIGFFATVGLIFSYLFAHPIVGLVGTSKTVSNMLSWIFYFYVETYAAFLIVLYWSYINDITTPDSAKKGYGMIIFSSQIGGLLTMIVSRFLVDDISKYTKTVSLLILMSMVMLSMLAVTVWILQCIVPKKELQGYQNQNLQKCEKLRVGFFDGLCVLVSRPYVAGIFGIIFFHECIATVMQFHMQVFAAQVYPSLALLTRFQFTYGLIVQLTACFFSLFATSYFQRILGIRFSLILYPLLLGCFIASYVLYPSLFLIVGVMVIAKAINYVINAPAKEVLYIPTSRDIKYKSKAWIDLFGARFSKGSASYFNKLVGPSVGIAGCTTLGLIGLWLILASFLGKTFQKITNAEKRIE